MLQITTGVGGSQPTSEESKVKFKPWPETEEKPKTGPNSETGNRQGITLDVRQLSVPQNRVEVSPLETYCQQTHLTLEGGY